MKNEELVQAAVRYCMNKVRDLEPEEKIETLEAIRAQLKLEADTMEMKVWAEEEIVLNF